MADYSIGSDPYIQSSIAALDTAANIWSTAATNETNERNVQRTNETNQAINQSNIEANKELWKLNAEYNSLQAQRKRAEEAGYSPAALLGSTGFNSSTSPTSVPSPIAMQAPHADRPVVGFGAIGEALQRAAVVENQQLLNEQQRIDNKSRERKNNAEIRERGSIADKNEWDSLVTEMTFNDQVVRAQAEAYEAYERGQRAKAEASIAKMEDYISTRYAESEKVKQLNLLDENIRLVQQGVSNAIKEGKNIDAARNEIMSRIRQNNASARQLELYNQYFEDVYDYRVQQEKREGQRAFYDTLFEQMHYLDERYNEFAKSNYSVDEARKMVKLLEEQRQNARLNNQFFYVNQATNMLGVLNQGIRTAQNGRFTDASIESMKRSQMGYRKSIRQQSARDGFYREEVMSPLQ